MAGYGISAKASREVRAAVAAFRLADSRIKTVVTTDTKAAFTSDWQRAVRADAALPPHGAERSRMLRNAGSVSITGRSPLKLVAYKSGGLPGGLKSSADYAVVEFGDGTKTFERYVTRSPKGRRYTVNRRTQQQLPPRQSEGYSVYPNVAAFVPRIVSYWVQSIVFTYFDALDGVID